MRYKTFFSLTTALLLNGCAVPALISLGLGAASVGVNESTGKTVSDHVVSGASGQDCRIARTFEGNDICQDTIVATSFHVTESKYPASTTAEINARYNK